MPLKRLSLPQDAAVPLDDAMTRTNECEGWFLPVKGGGFCLVDEDDYQWAKDYECRSSPGGYVFLHDEHRRVAALHHINEIKWDNRWLNLQVLTKAEHRSTYHNGKSDRFVRSFIFYFDFGYGKQKCNEKKVISRAEKERRECAILDAILQLTSD
jgi:hypothetical protein